MKRKRTSNLMEAINRSVQYIGCIPPDYYLRETKVLCVPGLIGLFTSEALPAGFVVGEYIGDRYTNEEFDALDICGAYLFEVSIRGKCVATIDGQNKDVSSFVRYVNSSLDESMHNCYFYQRGRRMFMRTYEDIPAHSELIACYGADTKDIINM